MIYVSPYQFCCPGIFICLRFCDKPSSIFQSTYVISKVFTICGRSSENILFLKNPLTFFKNTMYRVTFPSLYVYIPRLHPHSFCKIALPVPSNRSLCSGCCLWQHARRLEPRFARNYVPPPHSVSFMPPHDIKTPRGDIRYFLFISRGRGDIILTTCQEKTGQIVF